MFDNACAQEGKVAYENCFYAIVFRYYNRSEIRLSCEITCLRLPQLGLDKTVCNK